MPDETLEPKTTGSAWRVEQVYGLAAVCLLVGVLVGYLFRGSQSPAPPAQAAVAVPASRARVVSRIGQVGTLASLSLINLKDQPHAPEEDRVRNCKCQSKHTVDRLNSQSA